MPRHRMLAAAGANWIDWSLPDWAWSVTTTGWSTYESGATGTGRELATLYGIWVGCRSRPLAGGTHTYGMEYLVRGDVYLVAGGLSYTWGYRSVYWGTATDPPSEIRGRLYAYRDYDGTVDETLVDSATAHPDIGTISKTVVLPAGMKSVRFKFEADNYSAVVSGVVVKEMVFAYAG